ncbi:hypothetical protein NSND_60849 [Nitrospira sp. ND1]|nr:hypothetical protein NSND_60849 [Nitrospira sp. ND1]
MTSPVSHSVSSVELSPSIITEWLSDAQAIAARISYEPRCPGAAGGCWKTGLLSQTTGSLLVVRA